MILSVSRRTDIPSYYSDWFINRIKEGFLYVRNPMNPHRVSRILLSPKVVDCIVFWTKNPAPMLAKLGELNAYKYYFQFTLTGYGRDIECNLPHKKEVLIPVFRELSGQIGSSRVVWRYDPVLFTGIYTPEYHLRAFAQIAAALKGYTKRCVISFVDEYAKNKKSMQEIGAYTLEEAALKEFAGNLAKIARENDMTIGSCAESIDLQECGIVHNSCIDKALIEEIIGCNICVKKDKNQRSECGCVESIDIGTYDTCRNGCKYCYANNSGKAIQEKCAAYDVHLPILCGKLTEQDMITERKVTSLKEIQLTFPLKE